MFLNWWRKLIRIVSKPSRRERSKPAHLRRASFRPWAEVLEDRVTPAFWTVTNALNDGSVGTLPWAVAQANADTSGAANITFASGPGQAFATGRTIALTASLRLSNTSSPIM